VTQALPSVPPTTAGPESAAVVWAFDPWRERPRAAASAAFAALALCALVVSLHLPFVPSVALCLACVGVLAPALSPAQCRLDGDGAARQGPLGWERRPWSAIRRIDAVPAGLLVSPYASPHWLDGPRALILPAPRARRDELVALARRLGSADAR
jgi:hypothetical protein